MPVRPPLSARKLRCPLIMPSDGAAMTTAPRRGGRSITLQEYFLTFRTTRNRVKKGGFSDSSGRSRPFFRSTRRFVTPIRRIVLPKTGFASPKCRLRGKGNRPFPERERAFGESKEGGNSSNALSGKRLRQPPVHGVFPPLVKGGRLHATHGPLSAGTFRMNPFGGTPRRQATRADGRPKWKDGKEAEAAEKGITDEKRAKGELRLGRSDEKDYFCQA